MKAVMNEVELYKTSNSLQKRDALQCLEEFSHKIKWKYCDDRLLDIGCGDGSVTNDILRRFVPDNFKLLVGCDISEQMVKHAQKHHRDERTAFTLLDIEDEVPEPMAAAFDHVFSFYALHWCRQQEKVFYNIYSLLAEGGDCLLLFLGHMPVYDVYRVLSKNLKWCRWVKDVEKYVSPYHDSQEPDTEVRRIMNKVGFKNVDVVKKSQTIIYDKLELLRKSVLAVNPFNIPKELHEEFMDDYLDVVRDMQLMDETNNNTVCVKTNYSILIAYGRKY